jgi:hypothetical protein
MYPNDQEMVWRSEYDQANQEIQDLQNIIWRAKDLVRDALYTEDLERCKSILYDVERELERA